MAGRPSNRDERYAQVMQALVRCVARFGLEGASLTQIADEAGLTRPLIRHHLGNRDEMIAALQGYVLESFAEQTEALIAALPEDATGAALVDILFSETTGSSPDMILAFAALTARAAEDANLRAACRESLLEFEATITGVLRQDHPQAEDHAINAAAHGILALYLNVASLAPLDMPTEWAHTAHALARSLLNRLGDPS
ncbi:TetR/AcrR family transcriptional regulator [Ruegeria sp. 2205SS24-7]|uniref:TetR/AcrR family transcriptional regulator n=1 Tax=Ruegeria discodermiae TaxID=3064389 RepID=UPI002741139D|nr:TetR/AcrR family transcriptional regulator [Ruegeria sp. 2205SS24-7]MDP5218467.1 TetR/AcrR family transcriptional regulator [Ruegeria sp. 2205SS24-7]